MLDRQTAKVLLTILVFTLVLAIVYVARTVFVIFTFAILFAYLIDPVVRFLQRHSLFFKNLRGPHILEAYLGLLILIAVAIHAMDPGLFRQVGGLIRGLPALSEQISTGEIATTIGAKYGWTDAQELRLKSFLLQHHERIRGVLENGQRVVPTAIGSLVLIPILGLFFLNDGAILADSVIQLVSTGENVEVFRSFASELNVMLQHYIKAKVILAGLSLVFWFGDDAAFGFPARIRSWRPGRSPGVHTRGRLDDISNYNRYDWSAHSFSLDLDGGIAGAMANANGLFYFAACRGA
jgi:predicted PurR-regulated permease PerM